MSSYMVTFTETIEHYVWVQALNESDAEDAAYQVAFDGHECGDDCSSSGWNFYNIEKEFDEPDRMP